MGRGEKSLYLVTPDLSYLRLLRLVKKRRDKICANVINGMGKKKRKSPHCECNSTIHNLILLLWFRTDAASPVEDGSVTFAPSKRKEGRPEHSLWTPHKRLFRAPLPDQNKMLLISCRTMWQWSYIPVCAGKPQLNRRVLYNKQRLFVLMIARYFSVFCRFFSIEF